MLRLKTVRMVLQLRTWNVRTMLQGGKMPERTNELGTYNTHIAELQETRWLNERWIDKKDYTLSMVETLTLEEEMVTGFILDKDARRSLTDFEPVNGRISKI